MQTFKVSKNDEGYCTALSFLVETLILASGCEANNTLISVSLATNEEMVKIRDVIRELISSVSGRLKGYDSVVQEHFQCLLSLFTRDVNTMLSDLGVEFLMTFGSSRDPNVVKEMRKLYNSYKQRDSLMVETKKSILYSLIMKTLITMY
jgi:hypothetical protein